MELDALDDRLLAAIGVSRHEIPKLVKRARAGADVHRVNPVPPKGGHGVDEEVLAAKCARLPNRLPPPSLLPGGLLQSPPHQRGLFSGSPVTTTRWCSRCGSGRVGRVRRRAATDGDPLAIMRVWGLDGTGMPQ